MTYEPDDVRDAFQRVRAIDQEHGRDPAAYLRRIGLPRTTIDLAFELADDSWAIVATHLGLDRITPEGRAQIEEMLRDEIRQAVAAGALRGILIGEALQRGGSR